LLENFHSVQRRQLLDPFQSAHSQYLEVAGRIGALSSLADCIKIARLGLAYDDINLSVQYILTRRGSRW
jgi:hypothetical protein